MTNRTTKVAPAILIGVLAGALLTIEATPLHAADSCLSGPKGAAPKGSHWYYRIDHATKRNCWYVRAEGGQTASAKTSRGLALPQAETPLQLSVANALAQASAADIAPVAAEPVPPVPQVNDLGATPAATDAGQSPLASRGFDQTTPDIGKSPMPQSDESGASVKPPAPSAAAAPSATPDKRSLSGWRGIPVLLLGIVGALAAAAIFASKIFKFGSARQNGWRDSHRDRSAPWDAIDAGETVRSPPLATNGPAPQTDFARERPGPVIPDEIVQLLAALSKEAAA